MTEADQPAPSVETIESNIGLRVSIVDVGATIQAISLPTPRGRIATARAHDHLGLSISRRDTGATNAGELPFDRA